MQDCTLLQIDNHASTPPLSFLQAGFDPEPMMSPDDIFPKLSGSQFYSTFDFYKGYWAIPMAEESKDFTTFVTSKGLMRFKVMPFGSTYNRMVRKLLEGAQDIESYVDDVL